ncbi:hypothetical protein BDZ94DRAFT_1239090 [Collybia nuda]|uniref:Uncharacterized protein n=1 Tax=Collybia nuda TaxID=64659 RepID=A0A9P5XXT6_9AGAR|nr:hypothetical protein BDZ94DRAFT_1239090 [Collybia nuda]
MTHENYMDLQSVIDHFILGFPMREALLRNRGDNTQGGFEYLAMSDHAGLDGLHNISLYTTNHIIGTLRKDSLAFDVYQNYIKNILTVQKILVEHLEKWARNITALCKSTNTHSSACKVDMTRELIFASGFAIGSEYTSSEEDGRGGLSEIHDGRRYFDQRIMVGLPFSLWANLLVLSRAHLTVVVPKIGLIMYNVRPLRSAFYEMDPKLRITNPGSASSTRVKNLTATGPALMKWGYKTMTMLRYFAKKSALPEDSKAPLQLSRI